MAGIVSVAQFKDIVQSLIGGVHQPRKGRYIKDSPSGELFTATGDRITGLKVKFYIEDDGDTWANSGLIKPSFIWDMKKIAGANIIDDGAYTTHLNLVPHNLKETDDGIYFLDATNSYLDSQIFDNSWMSNKNILLNLWFTPNLKNVAENSNLFILYNLFSEGQHIHGSSAVLKIDIIQTNENQQSLHISKLNSSGVIESLFSNIPLFTDNLNHFQLYITATKLVYFINGQIEEMVLTSGIDPTFIPQTNSRFEIGKGFCGEINYLTYLVTSQTIVNDYLYLLNKLRYPLPRGKQLVDLSDYYEINGKNLFVNTSSISKAIENLRGQLFVKTNSVKVNN